MKLVCKLLGHKPARSQYLFVTCTRCHAKVRNPVELRYYRVGEKNADDVERIREVLKDSETAVVSGVQFSWLEDEDRFVIEPIAPKRDLFILGPVRWKKPSAPPFEFGATQ